MIPATKVRQSGIENAYTCGRNNYRVHRARAKGPKFHGGLFQIVVDIVKIVQGKVCVRVWYNELMKHHEISHSRRVSIWMTKLASFVLLNYCLQMPFLRTLNLLVHGTGPWHQRDQGPQNR